MSENNSTSEVLSRDNLIANDDGIITQTGTLLSGENRKRGTVLGRITLGAVSETHAGNTGNGAFTADATTPLLANAQAGAYKAVCITAATNGGTFRIYDPKGNVLGDVAVGGTFANQIKFVIADGATDFIVGDTFIITVAAGSLKYKMSLAAAVDGSQVPSGILVKDTDASGGDVDTSIYVAGEFNENAVTLGTGHTADSIRDTLRSWNLYLKKAVTA
jgi:hypothetical protein